MTPDILQNAQNSMDFTCFEMESQNGHVHGDMLVLHCNMIELTHTHARTHTRKHTHTIYIYHLSVP